MSLFDWSYPLLLATLLQALAASVLFLLHPLYAVALIAPLAICLGVPFPPV